MSKMGNAVCAGQEFAQQNYNVARDDFVKLVKQEFKSMATVEGSSAMEEYDVIQLDLNNYESYLLGDVMR